MYPVTTKFRNTFHKPHKRVVRVDVCKFDGTVIQALDTIIDGSVTVDETQQTRRTLSLTIESQGHNIDNLIPRIQSDILNPGSGNELRVYRGIDYQDGTPNEYVPLGVFRLSKPVITEKTQKSGDVKFEIAITGNDRSFWISRLAWTAPYTIEQGTNLGVALMAAVDSRVGPNKITYRFRPTSAVVQYTVWGMTTGSSNNPWNDFTNLAASFGYELFFDINGALVFQEIATSDTLLLPDVACFEEGATCTTTALELTLDETSEYNGVIVIARGKGVAVAPVRAEVWDTDPGSPTYYLGPWGKVPYIFVTNAFPVFGQSDAEALAQALIVAQGQFQRLSQQLNSVSISAVPCPFIQEGDTFTVSRSAMGIGSGEQYIAQTMTFPLDTSTEMVITNRPKRTG